jgi:hypothetical protein
MRFFLFVLLLLTPVCSLAAGNHPEAGACSPTKPYFAICTHSFHSLEGWYSDNCHVTQETAQKDADEHANKYHQGKSRWTGVSKKRSSGYDKTN